MSIETKTKALELSIETFNTEIDNGTTIITERAEAFNQFLLDSLKSEPPKDIRDKE